MKRFKKRWDITQNWQLLFPLFGLLSLGYTSYKISNTIVSDFGLITIILLTIVLSFALLKFTLFLFKKLEKKWILDAKWEMIRVFIVGRPIIEMIGITKENLNPILYWVLFIIIGLIFYQILLVTFGWLFGQYKFFWNFEKKMLRRFGLGRFVD